MGKCDCYHVTEGRGYRYDTVTGKPIPHTYEYGICLGTKERERCSCDGDEVRCDFYPQKRKKAEGEEIHCRTCKHFYNMAVECRMRNCHRAFSARELENKDFVTDAWEKAD